MYKLVQNVLNLGQYSKCVRLVQLKRAKFVSYVTTYWQSYRSGNKPTLLQILYSMHLFTCCEIWKCLSAVCIFNGKVLFSLNCIHKRNFWLLKIMQTSICHRWGCRPAFFSLDTPPVGHWYHPYTIYQTLPTSNLLYHKSLISLLRNEIIGATCWCTFFLSWKWCISY